MLIQSKQHIRDKLAVVLLSQGSGIKVILGIISILIGIGFLLGDTDRRNYAPIMAAGPALAWTVIFILHGIFKLLDAFCTLPFLVSTGVSIVGIWTWNYLFLSLTVFSMMPVTPIALLLVLPILCEVWSLTTTIYYNTHKVGSTDA